MKTKKLSTQARNKVQKYVMRKQKDEATTKKKKTAKTGSFTKTYRVGKDSLNQRNI